MYELTVEREFCAAHAIRLGGELEPIHGHNWNVRITVGGPELDHEGLLCDFHALEQMVDGAIAPFQNRCFNETPPFDTLNPTAELIARHLGKVVAGQLPAAVHLVSASVTEAPGCRAIWRPTNAQS